MPKTDNSKKTNILITFGTRPEAIKLAPIIKILPSYKKYFNFKVCSTGQHREMLKQVIDFFEIKPDFKFDIMADNQKLSSLSAKVLGTMDEVFGKFIPDIVLIQGDTTTAFLTALFSYYNKVKIGHVEAGLRTYDKYNPFPEEINRRLISNIADFNFAPTKTSYDNLIGEKVSKDTICISGNTIVDAINWGLEKIKKYKNSIQKLEPFNKIDYNKKIIVVTMHRRESFGNDIMNVCHALKEIAGKYAGVQIVYPVHLNPNVREPVFSLLSNVKNILLIEPLNYESFLCLMNSSYFIITDSGGIQEEAPTLKKPVLVIRKKTEREESLKLGFSKLIGTSKETIIKEASNLIENEIDYMKMMPLINPYGDGNAAEKILNFIKENINAG